MTESRIARLDRWLFEPHESLVGKPLWLVLRVLRYPYALIRDLARGELTLRAMSLVYTTLLSIVPLLALSFSLLKGLGYHRDLEPVLYEFLEPIGEKAFDLTARVMDFVERVQGGVLGSLGMAFLLYTVISMIQKVEESFNFVWRVERPRSFARRFSEYLSVLIVGPVLIVAALGLLATLSSHSTVQTLTHMEPMGSVMLLLGRLVPYLLVVAVFTFVYAFIPNTRVRLQAALIGGIAAGILWTTIGALFARFVATSSQATLIYAGFAIVIVALIWLHVSWLILLVGAQLSFYVQNPQCLRPGRGELHLTSSLRERLALSVMYMVGKDFKDHGPRWTVNELSEQLELPSASLGPVVDSLEAAGLLVGTDDERLVPGRDPASIGIGDILDAVRKDAGNPRVPKVRCAGPAEEIARAADEALKDSVTGKTLREMVQR